MTFAIVTANATRHKRGRIVLRYFICLVIAFILWLFTSLSDQHENTIHVDINYALAAQKTNVNRLPTYAELQVSSTGWQLLREAFNQRSLTLDLADYTENKMLLTNQHIHLFSEGLPDDIKVIQIFPDTLDMQIENKLSKKVPVKMGFRGIVENDWIVDSMYYYPDSITITGPESVVNTFRYWPTEVIKLYDIDSIVKGVSILQFSKEANIQLSAIAVAYGIRVFRKTTQTYKLNITHPDQADNVITVAIECMIPSGLVAQTKETDFQIKAIPLKQRGVYALKCEQFPEWAQNINITPAFISLTSSK